MQGQQGLEVRILGDDGQIFLSCVCPDFGIGGRVKTEQANVKDLVEVTDERGAKPCRKHLTEKKANHAFRSSGSSRLVRHAFESRSVRKTGADIRFLQLRKVGEYLVDRHAGSHHRQHIGHGDARTTHDRLAGTASGFRDDSRA